MTVRYLNPDTLHRPFDGMYSHVSQTSATTFFRIGGQVAVDREGASLALGDMAGQIRACYDCVTGALESVGIGWPNVTHILTFTTDMDSYLRHEQEIARQYFGDTPPPSTLVAVPRLVQPEWLVEVQVDAAA